MKKRNILTAVLALALVAVIAVGGTLAYLTDTDDQVVNTFTFAQGMEVQLWEPDPQNSTNPAFPIANESVTGDPEKGWDYTNVVPGQDLIKAPTLATTTSVDAYVFVKVDGFTNDLTRGEIKNEWKTLNEDEFGNGIFYKEVTGAASQQELLALFETVKVADNLAGTTSLPKITIDVYEIQAASFASAAEALEQTPFKTTTTGA